MDGKNPTRKQISRLLHIREWLEKGRHFNAKTMAGKLGVSRRTVMNDLNVLRELGFAVEYDRKRNSYLLSEPSGEFPLPQIRKSEFTAITLAQDVFETFGAQPMAHAAERITNRVRELIPDFVGLDLSTFSPSLSILRGPSPRNPLPYFEEFDRYIEETRSVEIRYFTMYRNRESTRLVDPYRLVSRDGRGYLIAWCHTRRDVLIFRLDRIRELKPCDRFFDTLDDFDLETFLGPMFGMFKDRETFRLKVRFSPWVARWIEEDLWHESQKFTRLPADGSLQVDMEVTGRTDVLRWILSFGNDAEVIEPEFLRRDIAYEIEKLGVTYGPKAG